MNRSLQLIPLSTLPLIAPHDDVPGLIVAALTAIDQPLHDDDIVVVAQKIISKAENRYCQLNDVVPSDAAVALSRDADKDPRLVECILRESTEVLRVRPGAIIVRHRNGYVHANAGIDQSNIDSTADDPRVLLLPADPDASAARLRERLHQLTGATTGVIINDSAGRPWRNGVVGFALGTAGLLALEDRVGAPDLYGRPLQITQVAVADELAAAASLLMGQANEGIPVVIIRGFKTERSAFGSQALIRDPGMDLFR